MYHTGCGKGAIIQMKLVLHGIEPKRTKIRNTLFRFVYICGYISVYSGLQSELYFSKYFLFSVFSNISKLEVLLYKILSSWWGTFSLVQGIYPKRNVISKYMFRDSMVKTNVFGTMNLITALYGWNGIFKGSTCCKMNSIEEWLENTPQLDWKPAMVRFWSCNWANPCSTVSLFYI